MSGINADQRSFWSKDAGPVWVARVQALDRAFAPVLDAVLERADLQPGARVLDIGCGAGTSTLAAADRVGQTGLACGVDISDSLLDFADQRAKGRSGVRFLRADAQTHAFSPDEFTCMISRFGVMFFDDFVAAFSNLRNGLAAEGRLAAATWGAIPENPYFTLAARIAKEIIAPVPRSDPDLPGPFALRDPARGIAILQDAGFSDVVVEETHLTLTPSGDVTEVAELLCDVGPAQKALSYHGADAHQRAALIEALAQALGRYETGQGIRIPALINLFTARKAA